MLTERAKRITSLLLMLIVLVSFSGCTKAPGQAMDPGGLSLHLTSAYDVSERSSSEPKHTSIDLPKEWPAQDQYIALLVHPLDGETYGSWHHTPPCVPGGHNMATGEVRKTDCSEVREADPVILPPPDAQKPRLYVLDSDGSITFQTPRPIKLGLWIDMEYSTTLQSKLDRDAACTEEGRPLAMIGSVAPGNGLDLLDGRLVLDRSGSAEVRFYGWCDTTVS